MNFKKFSSLENHYREKFIDFCRIADVDLNKFMATEKIHGANFSFWVTHDGVKVGKRSGFTDFSFYGCGDVVNRYTENMFDLWDNFSRNKKLVTIAVYGELYGAGIQKEIDYGEKDFIAFDMHFHYEDGTVEIQSKAAAYEACIDVGIPFVPFYAVGTMDEMLAIDVESLRSKVAKDSFIEGIVIEPVDPAFLANGERLIIKKKTKVFSESKVRKPKTPPEPLSPAAENLYNVGLTYFTAERLSNVISHEGLQERKMFGKVIGWLMKDALDDLAKENAKVWHDVEKAERKRVQKMFNNECAAIIKANWDTVFEM